MGVFINFIVLQTRIEVSLFILLCIPKDKDGVKVVTNKTIILLFY